MLGNGVADARDDARSENTWIDNRCVTQLPEDANICDADPTASTGSFSARSAAGPVIPPGPRVDQSGWPCLRVPVWDLDPVRGGVWAWITVVAPDAPAGTFCGA
jgi:hypothetical protein